MSDKDDLTYTLPPDILRYETKYFFGFGINELLIAATAGLVVMMLVSTLVGLLTGVIVLVSLRRYESLGNRSLPAYALAIVWRRLSTAPVVVPRTFPSGSGGRVEFISWEGEKLFALEEG